MYIHFYDKQSKKNSEKCLLYNNNYYKKIIVYICQKDNLL